MDVMSCKRNINLDFLAIVASFLVVFLHQTAQISESEYIYIYIYRVIAECAVPLFVMKSGALLLSEEKMIDYRYIGRAALRIVAIIVLWGLFYHSICNMLIDGISWLAIKKAVISVITAETTFNYQFWYLYMLLGLYAVTPIMRQFLHHAERTDYIGFFLISFVVGFAIPFSCRLLNIDLQIVWVERWFPFFSTYLLYYFLGYYCSIHPASKRTRLILITLVILGGIITVLGYNGNFFGSSEAWITYDSPFTLAYATLLFSLVIKCPFEENTLFVRKVVSLASCSLGVFILHPMVIVAMRKLIHIEVSSFCPAISIPILTIVVYVLCATAAWLIKKLPIFKYFI